MFQECAINFLGKWYEHLPHVELSYNNSDHYSIVMPPYEALYGRKCRTLFCWFEAGEKTNRSRNSESLMKRLKIFKLTWKQLKINKGVMSI